VHSFSTERLLIRPLAEQDKELFASLYTNAKTMRHIAEPLSNIEVEQAFSKTLNAMRKGKPNVLTWAIVTLDNNECIGLQALNWQKSAKNNINVISHTAEIGIMLSPSSHGKSIPKEATGAIIEYAFNYLPINRIEAHFSKRNIVVGRITKNFGFKDTTTLQTFDEHQKIHYIDKPFWHSQYIKNIIEDSVSCQVV
jgi:RimJ/RimL family protein N-acetyltransferase